MLGTDDWKKVITEIEKDLGGFPTDRKTFYTDFLNWLKEALQHTTIIVVEGNIIPFPNDIDINKVLARIPATIESVLSPRKIYRDYSFDELRDLIKEQYE